MATVPVARLRDDLVRLADRGADVDEYARAAARVLGRAVPFDEVCVVTMDPSTQLPTSEFVDSGLPESTRARMAEIEGGGADHNAFSALARSDRPAAALSDATGGDLDRSLRHRELRAPNRLGDELRAVLAEDGAIWGGLTLLRGDDQPPSRRPRPTRWPRCPACSPMACDAPSCSPTGWSPAATRRTSRPASSSSARTTRS